MLSNTYLLQVVLIIGVFGGCRREELTQLTVRQVKDEGYFFKIRILDAKNRGREFIITNGDYIDLNCLEIIRKYSSLRPQYTTNQRFFISYRCGKCTAQPVGINTIGAMPKRIATYLQLENPEDYTGHCFRRSSSALLGKSRNYVGHYYIYKQTKINYHFRLTFTIKFCPKIAVVLFLLMICLNLIFVSELCRYSRSLDEHRWLIPGNLHRR